MISESNVATRRIAAKSKSAAATSDCEVVIIGAGPYGLSAAAHLKSKGLSVRVFGKPMDFWENKMPAGMLLRSPRVASNISDPGQAFGLEVFSKKVGAQLGATSLFRDGYEIHVERTRLEYLAKPEWKIGS